MLVDLGGDKLYNYYNATRVAGQQIIYPVSNTLDRTPHREDKQMKYDCFKTEGHKVTVAHVLAQIAMGVCKIHHSAIRSGYVSRRPNDDGTIGEAYTYSGRYGTGYILHLPLHNVSRWHEVQYVTFEPDCLTPLVGTDDGRCIMSIGLDHYVTANGIAADCNTLPNDPRWRVGVLADISNPYMQYSYCIFDASAGKWYAKRGMYTGCKILTYADYRRILLEVSRNAD